MSDSRRFLRTAEAALRVGLSPRTLERYRVTGNGPPFRHLGRVVVYDVGDLDAWVSAAPLFTSTTAMRGEEGMAVRMSARGAARLAER
jgi:hypothetical protein